MKTNKTRTITHYIICQIASLIAALTFISIIFIDGLNSDINWLPSQPSAVLAITFVTLIIYFGLIYGIVTIFLSNGSSPIRIMLPWALTTFSMAIIIAIISFAYTKIIVPSLSTWDIIWLTLISFASVLLIVSSQIFNSKFLMISTSNSRSDEWEMNNFANMLITNSNIRHDGGVSYLKFKNDTFVIKFIPEEEIERKIDLSGDLISEVIQDLKNKLKYGQNGFLVYLSNKLPEVHGTSDQIKVIKNSDLFKEAKIIIKQRKIKGE